MSGPRWPIAGLILAMTTIGSQAAPLTCDQFKERFIDAVIETGEKALQLPVFLPASGGGGHGPRYKWQSYGISGTMSCDTDNRFQEFFVNARFETKQEFANTITRFLAVAGATIRALATDNATVSGDYARAMLQDTLEQLGRGYSRGSKTASGLTDRTPVEGVSAELTAAANLLTFLLSPNAGVTLEEARQPLLPVKAAK